MSRKEYGFVQCVAMAYPCGSCGSGCESGVICCDKLHKLYHMRCATLSAVNFEHFQGRTITIVRKPCRSTLLGEFDYQSGLKRLSSAYSDIGSIKKHVSYTTE